MHKLKSSIKTDISISVNFNLKIEYKNNDNLENKTSSKPADQDVFLTAANAK